MATTDYPSSAGNAVMNDAKGKKDAAFTTLFRTANAIAFGKTNTPDFAASWVCAHAPCVLIVCFVRVCASMRGVHA